MIYARTFADEAHSARDQKHGDRPYVAHLDEVVEVLRRHGINDETMIAAAYLHDVVEDTQVTLDKIEFEFGAEVAELVYAVTNEPGKNRAERHAATYPKIRSIPGATALKLADRIANVARCRADNTALLNMYRREHDGFVAALRIPGQYDAMWTALEALLER